MNKLRKFLAAITLVAGLVSVSGAPAQGIGSRPVRMIVPFAAGGVVDVVARAVAQELGQAYGQPVIVDNRVGANGNIGMEACSKSAPDGNTLCIATGVIVSLNPYAYAKMPFDPERDLVPVVHVGTLDITIAVNASLPVNSVRELVDYAKSKPGIVTWSSLGLGSTAHLYMEWLHARTGAAFNHIPYKGQPPMVQAAISGEVNVTMLPPGAVLPLVQNGRLKVVAMMSGKKRSSLMPEIPTFLEQGYDLDFRNWIGVLLPRGASSETVRRLNADFNRLLADPKFTDRYLTSMGVTPTGGTTEEFAAFLKTNRETAAELAKIAKLRLD